MSSGKEIFAKTIYGEARGESREGQQEVARVIRERAAQNKSYWGGSRIEDVCKKPGQFECWQNGDIRPRDEAAYRSIRSWSDQMYDQPLRSDPNCPDHYNNPDKEGYPEWTNNCNRMHKTGGHQFYRSKHWIGHIRQCFVVRHMWTRIWTKNQYKCATLILCLNFIPRFRSIKKKIKLFNLYIISICFI